MFHDSTSMASTISTALFWQRTSWSWCLDPPRHQNDQYWPLFVEWIIKNLIFHWYPTSFLWEAVEASHWYFFENWLIKNQMSLPPEQAIWDMKISNFPEPIYFVHFNVSTLTYNSSETGHFSVMKKNWDLKNVFSNMELEGQGLGIIMGVTCLLLLGPFYFIQNNFLYFFTHDCMYMSSISNQP